jgi:hypothetical protein
LEVSGLIISDISFPDWYLYRSFNALRVIYVIRLKFKYGLHYLNYSVKYTNNFFLDIKV